MYEGKRLPTKITGLLRQGLMWTLFVAYAVVLFLCIDVAIKMLPSIENGLFDILAEFAVIVVVFIVGIALFLALMFSYAIVEPFIVENILPKNFKIYLNIDKIEETYLPKNNK